MKKQFDFLIVGAGPAGGFAAYKLARAGFKILVIDRNPRLTQKVCGEYLCPKAVKLIEDEGLDHELLSSYLPIYGMNIFTPHGREVVTEFPSNNGMQRGLSLNRQKFDSDVVELAERHGAEFHFGESLETFVLNENEVHIKTSHAEYVTKILIGADGRKSRVAALLGVHRVCANKRVAVHAYLKTLSPAKRVGEMHLFSDGSYAGIDPVGEKTHNFSIVCDGQQVKKLGGPLKTLQHYILQSDSLKNRFGNISSETDISTASPLSHSVEQIASQRVALVGDAAGFVDPLTGEGIFNALYSSQLLCEKLIATHQAQSALTHALVEYANEHKKNTRAKTKLNMYFQMLIRAPVLIEIIAILLTTRKKYADIFIGVVGNIYTPFEGLKKLFSFH